MWRWPFLFFFSQLCPILTSSVINLYELKFNTRLDKVQSVISVAIPFIVIGTIIIQAKLIKNSSANNNDEEFKNKYGILLDN